MNLNILKKVIFESENIECFFGYRYVNKDKKVGDESLAGTFYTLYPQNRKDKKYKLCFEKSSILKVSKEEVEPFEGMPSECLVGKFNLFDEINKYEGNLGEIIDILVAREAKKEGYNVIVYGGLELQDLTTITIDKLNKYLKI